MPTFYRVPWPEEAKQIRETGIVPTNHNRWRRGDDGHYEPRSVVFLIQDTGKSIPFFKGFFESQRDEYGCTHVLRFDLEAEVEKDASGWGGYGSVVHPGPIDLSEADNVEWIEIGAV